MEGGESEEEKNSSIQNGGHKTKNSKRTKQKQKKGKKIIKTKLWIDLELSLSRSDDARQIGRLEDKHDNHLLVRVP